MSEIIKFHSAWYCPFAQRVWAALEHFDIPYVYEETDPYDKSDRWLEISRGIGQVPVLQITNQNHTEARIPDSLRIMEFLDETPHTNGALFPTHPLVQAEARFWLDQQGKEIIPQFYRFLKAKEDSAAASEAMEQMIAGLKQFTHAMSATGPYFFGERPGVVDFAFAPFALRIEILLSHYKSFRLPRSGELWQRYHAWLQAVKSHSSFIATMPNLETYEARLIEFYSPYSLGGGQEDVTKAA